MGLRIIFEQSEKANLNYLTKIVKIDNLRPHPNPEVTRLDITTVNGSDIIVGRGSVNMGDVVVYCPCESSLNLAFLRENNQFRDIEMNKVPDKKKCGFFENKGRVKAISLKGVISTGFIFPVEWLNIWQPDLAIKDMDDYIDVSFDTVNGQLFSKKYVIRPQRQPVMGDGKKKVKRNNRLQRFDKLIKNQFSFHYDTGKLVDQVFTIDPDDIISITTKYHGTSVIISNVLVNKELKWYEKLLKRCGVDMTTQVYDYLYSSRGVIKNRYINKNAGSFYSVDVWTSAGERLKEFVSKGMTIYAEIVGYLPSIATFIQKNHDYKCKTGEFEIYVYRITQTNVDGEVYEFSAKQIQNWCKSRDIKPVKELYYGKAKDVYPDLSTEQHWHQNFVNKLANDKERFYMEANSPDCYNEVPHEGIVIRNDSTGYNALKLKTKRHFLMETAELDSGEADIESIEETEDDSTE